MAEYSGSAFYGSWTSTAGTVTTLASDHKKWTYDPEIETIEITNGADAVKTYLAGVKGGKANITMAMQAAGTALTNALVEGAFGTLIIAAEGTASGKPKMTIPAFSMGVKYNESFNDVVEISVDFLQSGLRVDGSY
jgi:hypothetical protein